MNKNCVIFDTNIIREHKGNLYEIKNKIISVADIIIPRMVIEEIQGQKSRNMIDDYKRIKGIIDKNDKFFKYDEKFTLNTVLTKAEKGLENWLLEYCNNKVLEHNNITLDEIIERAKEKKPPFINETGSSDKGFKDSVIWKSVLKSEILEEYDLIIFVTKDNSGFKKYQEELYTEYKKERKSEFKLCSTLENVYKILDIGEKDDDNEEIKEETNKKIDFQIKDVDIEEIKNNMNDCIEELLYETVYDQWGNEYRENRFEIYTKLTESKVLEILETLEDYLKECIFFNYINITDLFNKFGIESSEAHISTKQLNKMNEIYLIVKSKKELLNPFILFVTTKINELYRIKAQKYNIFDIKDEELPF